MFKSKKILFCAGNLSSGGRERRLLELLTYLKRNTNHQIMVVFRQEIIDYPLFYELRIPYKLLQKKYKKIDFFLPKRFNSICNAFQPDIIHCWGRTSCLIPLMMAYFNKIFLINSQITNAKTTIKKWSLNNLINRINFLFSDVILSNSYAGLKAYKPPLKKSMVIYNGVNIGRFENLPERESTKSKYQITTKYAIAMVASFTRHKNYDLYVDVANRVCKARRDISFICVGDGPEFQRISERAKSNSNIILTGLVSDVEAIINCVEIGVLLTNRRYHEEGVSNSIIEYMAMGKPVLANNSGGSGEIVNNDANGYLFDTDCPGEIANKILELIENPEKQKTLGKAGRMLIEEQFTIEKMGDEFIKLYERQSPGK